MQDFGALIEVKQRPILSLVSHIGRVQMLARDTISQLICLLKHRECLFRWLFILTWVLCHGELLLAFLCYRSIHLDWAGLQEIYIVIGGRLLRHRCLDLLRLRMRHLPDKLWLHPVPLLKSTVRVSVYLLTAFLLLIHDVGCLRCSRIYRCARTLGSFRIRRVFQVSCQRNTLPLNEGTFKSLLVSKRSGRPVADRRLV